MSTQVNSRFKRMPMSKKADAARKREKRGAEGRAQEKVNLQSEVMPEADAAVGISLVQAQTQAAQAQAVANRTQQANAAQKPPPLSKKGEQKNAKAAAGEAATAAPAALPPSSPGGANPAAKADVTCDKCDGPHASAACLHFKKGRDI